VADYDKLLPGDHQDMQQWGVVDRMVVAAPSCAVAAMQWSSNCHSSRMSKGVTLSNYHQHTVFAGAAGWSHFAQFTIAVVNKDPKKSKYSGKPASAAGYKATRGSPIMNTSAPGITCWCSAAAGSS
jgi:hypothetical protein